MSEPKLPDELWAIHSNAGFEGNNDLWISCTSDKGCIEYHQKQSELNQRLVLVGVHPAWRDRAERAEAEVERLRRAAQRQQGEIGRMILAIASEAEDIDVIRPDDKTLAKAYRLLLEDMAKRLAGLEQA